MPQGAARLNFSSFLKLAGRTQIGVAPGGGSVTELFVFREPIVRRLTAGGRWIRTTGTAAQKPWISAAFRALRGYRRGSETIPPDGSALVLLRLEPLHRARLGHGLSRLWLAGLRGGFRLLAVQLIYTFARHRLDQQFAERPDQGINAVRRIPRRGPVDIRSKICHLVFELREGADVMDAALVVERRHRFGPHHLATRGADRGKRDVWVDHAKRGPDHVAAIVDLGDDAVGPMRPVGGDRQAGPLGRRITPREVGQHIAVAVLSLPATMMPVSSASSPDVTAGSMATTTRVIAGAERSRLASIEPSDHSAPGVSSSSSASSSCRPSRVPSYLRMI